MVARSRWIRYVGKKLVFDLDGNDRCDGQTQSSNRGYASLGANVRELVGTGERLNDMQCGEQALANLRGGYAAHSWCVVEISVGYICREFTGEAGCKKAAQAVASRCELVRQGAVADPFLHLELERLVLRLKARTAQYGHRDEIGRQIVKVVRAANGEIFLASGILENRHRQAVGRGVVAQQFAGDLVIHRIRVARVVVLGEDGPLT